MKNLATGHRVLRPGEPDGETSTPRDFAPVSRAPSARLSLVAGYFTVAGGLTVCTLGALVAAGVIWRPSAVVGGLFAHPLMAATWGASGIGLLWTGRKLRRRSIAGWYSALATLALPLVPSIFGKPISWGALVAGGIGIMVLVSVRDELKCDR